MRICLKGVVDGRNIAVPYLCFADTFDISKSIININIVGVSRSYAEGEPPQ